jgi:hypothetical protein
MNDRQLDVLERMERLLQRLLRLQAATILKEELAGEFEKKLYAVTGTKNRTQILKDLKCGPNRVSELWNRWEQLGLLVKDGNSYRKVI